MDESDRRSPASRRRAAARTPGAGSTPVAGVATAAVSTALSGALSGSAAASAPAASALAAAPARVALGHAELVDRLRRRLGEHRPQRVHLAGFRPAAVAIILGEVAGITRVTLTLRSPHLRAHSGQVSLPGGVRDPGDTSAAATALRESHEEIGVTAGQLRVVGVLDDQPTISRYIITPIVTELVARPRYRRNPDEVAEIFEAPLALFGDPARAEDLGERLVAGRRYRARSYRYRDYRIRGATARILEQLVRLVDRWPGQ
ncbi:MAG: CoA pyrophosphatase [Myxococcota bacterium]